MNVHRSKLLLLFLDKHNVSYRLAGVEGIADQVQKGVLVVIRVLKSSVSVGSEQDTSGPA
jgi:hypothetical protein